jgi:pimeloyl-ACP methyl ester carboxylesterase
MATAVRTRNLARATAAEVRSLGHLAVRYPLGLLAHETPRMSPSTSTPVVLVHGFGANKSCFGPLKRSLRASGLTSISSFNYNPLRHDLPALAQQLATEVARVRHQTGAKQVHLVGHSLGGLLIRYYVTHLDGAKHVDTAITIGTPHGGSMVGMLGALIGNAGRTARQVIPGSRLLADLNDQAHKAETVRWIAYHAHADVIVPSMRSKLDHATLAATNIAVKGVGHLALLTDDAVVRDIPQHLLPPTLERQQEQAA